MTKTTSGQDHLFLPILTVSTPSFANWQMYFVQFVMNLTISLFLVTLVQGGKCTSFVPLEGKFLLITLL
jgi:hypothetical protein